MKHPYYLQHGCWNIRHMAPHAQGSRSFLNIKFKEFSRTSQTYYKEFKELENNYCYNTEDFYNENNQALQKLTEDKERESLDIVNTFDSCYVAEMTENSRA